jgi:hypothetical protein
LQHVGQVMIPGISELSRNGDAQVLRLPTTARQTCARGCRWQPNKGREAPAGPASLSSASARREHRQDSLERPIRGKGSDAVHGNQACPNRSVEWDHTQGREAQVPGIDAYEAGYTALLDIYEAVSPSYLAGVTAVVPSN